MNAGIFSLTWQNIDDRVLAAQRRVFEHFQFTILQHRIAGLEHGQWMDFVMQNYPKVDLFMFVDADAFPLNKLAIVEAFDKAAQGFLYGNAQVSSHIDPNRLFVAPSWCAVSRSSWIAASCPSARLDHYSDIGQRWTDQMSRFGIKIEMLKPKSCLKPLWKLPDGTDFGIGTTFESAAGARNFHMFGIGGTTYGDPQFPPDVRLRVLEEQAAKVCAGK